MESLPPAWASAIFNTNAFRGIKYLTREEADLLYLSVVAGVNLPLIDGITPGIVTASKAVIVDSLKNITGFNSLTSTTITADTLNAVNVFNCTGDAYYTKDFGTINFSGAHANITFTGIDSNILLSGNSSIINMNGAASSLLLSGNATKIILAGTGGYISLSNTQASNNINTGALRIAGGAYFGNDIVIATQASFGSSVINQTNAAYLVGISTGTVSASKCVVVDINKDITGFRNLTLTGILSTPSITISGSTASTSNITGVLLLAGGIGISNTTDAISNTNGGTITTAGGVAIAKKIFIGSNAEIASTTRITGGSSPVTGSGLELAFGSSTSNIYSYNRGTSTYLDLNLNDKVLIVGATGNTSISSTTATTSTTTGALVISGGIGCGGRVYASRFTSNNNGSNYELINGSNTGLLELALSPNILRLVNGYAINVGTVGVTIGNGSTLVPRFPLDFQATAGDIQICLFAGTSAATSAYGIGANNSAVEYHSAVDHKFYNATKITGSTVTLGTNVLNVNSVGNVIAAAGVHATGFSTTGLSSYGPAVHMHYGGSTGSVFTYDYSASSYGNLALNNNCIQCLSNGYINVNTSSTTVAAPLSVYGNASFTRLSGTYGYLASSGSGTASGFSGRAFGIYSQYGILVDNGEIDCFSDLRMKKEVLSLDDELCARFIKNINPIQFKYMHNNTRQHYGYGAQQLISFGFDTLVGLTNADEPLPNENINIYEIDPNGELGDMKLTDISIDLPSDVRCTVSMLDMIPILHKCIQMQVKRLDKQQLDIEQLKQQINELKGIEVNTDQIPIPSTNRRKKRIIKL